MQKNKPNEIEKAWMKIKKRVDERKNKLIQKYAKNYGLLAIVTPLTFRNKDKTLLIPVVWDISIEKVM